MNSVYKVTYSYGFDRRELTDCSSGYDVVMLFKTRQGAQQQIERILAQEIKWCSDLRVEEIPLFD